jgi:hypothetical protein
MQGELERQKRELFQPFGRIPGMQKRLFQGPNCGIE